LKPPGIKLLKLKYDRSLSNFAFKFNLRRYTEVSSVKKRAHVGLAAVVGVGAAIFLTAV
jgi:hypothetical protein